MSKLKENRLKAINRMMLNYGIEYGNHIFISMWDLAGNLNNCWHAGEFIPKNQWKTQYGTAHERGRFVLKEHYHSKLFRGIRHAVKGSGIELRESYNNKSEYLIMKAAK